MKPAKLFLFLVTACAAALVSAFAGGLIAEAAAFSGEAGFMLGGALSLTGTAVRVFAPGLFAGAAFANLPTAEFPTSGFRNVQIYSQQRAYYEAIVADNRNKGFGEILPLASYLRSEVVLGLQNSVDFALRDNEQVPGQPTFGTENRLRQNDAFYPEHYSVMFSTWEVDADPLITAANRARARLHSFPNLDVFGLNTPSLVAAYNGLMALRMNDTVYIDSLDLLRFLRAKQAQEGLAVSAVAVTGVQDTSDWEGNDMFAHLDTPLVRLNGQFNNRFSVKFPANLSFSLVANVNVSIVLYLRGWLMQNGGSTRTPVNKG